MQRPLRSGSLLLGIVLCSASAAQVQGGPGRGDSHASYATTAEASIYQGGLGRGDAHAASLIAGTWIAYHGGAGRGDAWGGSSIVPLSEWAYHGGYGRGDTWSSSLSAPTTTWAYFGGQGRGDVHAVLLVPSAPTIAYRGGPGRGDHVGVLLLPQDIRLYVRALLEGPYDGDFAMHDSLRAKGLVPLTEPYTALGFAHVGGGGETTMPSVLDQHPNGNVVDWVLIELRSAADPSVIIATRSALLLSNGLVVDTDGVSPVTFSGLSPGFFHVALLHRNHLGVMSGSPTQLMSSQPGFVDFAQPYSMTYGVESRKYVFPNMLLWAGDVNGDGLLKYVGEENDRDPILVAIGGSAPTNTLSGYRSEDVNMDGVAKYVGENNDRDPILVNIGGSVPTHVRQAQLP